MARREVGEWERKLWGPVRAGVSRSHSSAWPGAAASSGPGTGPSGRASAAGSETDQYTLQTKQDKMIFPSTKGDFSEDQVLRSQNR